MNVADEEEETTFGRKLVYLASLLALLCASINSAMAAVTLNSTPHKAMAPFAIMTGVGSGVALICAAFWTIENY